MTLEGVPCVLRWAIDEIEDQTFEHCKKTIHHLSYTPKEWAPHCQQTAGIVKNFLHANCIELVLFKGGTLEMDLCAEIGYCWKNLEDWNVCKTMA